MKIACQSRILGKGYTLPAAVELLSRLGYEGVEWRIRDDFHLPLYGLSEKLIEAAALCTKAGLEISALTTYIQLEETERAAEVLRAAAKVGCPQVRLLVPQYDGTVAYKALFDRTRHNLAAIEALCQETEIKVTLAVHMANLIPSASAAFRLVEGFSPDCIGVIFDPGNMVCEGRENWKMGIEVLGPYLAKVQIKNAGWYHSAEEGWQFGWAGLEEGIIDWRKVISALQECGYRGWLVVEDFADIPIEQKLAEDYALLRGYLEPKENETEQD